MNLGELIHTVNRAEQLANDIMMKADQIIPGDDCGIFTIADANRIHETLIDLINIIQTVPYN